jgi:drug/metabolite transporter (DMT)-like permease
VRPAGIFGIILIVVGIVIVAYGGFASFTTRENVAKLGPLEVNKEKEHPVPVGPIVGGVCIVGGAILLITGRGRAV